MQICATLHGRGRLEANLEGIFSSYQLARSRNRTTQKQTKPARLRSETYKQHISRCCRLSAYSIQVSNSGGFLCHRVKPGRHIQSSASVILTLLAVHSLSEPWHASHTSASHHPQYHQHPQNPWQSSSIILAVLASPCWQPSRHPKLPHTSNLSTAFPKVNGGSRQYGPELPSAAPLATLTAVILAASWSSAAVSPASQASPSFPAS